MISLAICGSVAQRRCPGHIWQSSELPLVVKIKSSPVPIESQPSWNSLFIFFVFSSSFSSALMAAKWSHFMKEIIIIKVGPIEVASYRCEQKGQSTFFSVWVNEDKITLNAKSVILAFIKQQRDKQSIIPVLCWIKKWGFIKPPFRSNRQTKREEYFYWK